MLITQDVCARLEVAAVVLVASVDATGSPTCAHAAALKVAPGESVATVYLPVATCQAILADIATNGRLAVTCGNPLDNGAVQLKGRSRRVRMAAEDERAFVDARQAIHAASIEHIGVPRRYARGLVSWPAFAVELAIEAVFDQTPGPRAGVPLGTR